MQFAGLALLALLAPAQDARIVDTDGDGLSDVHEVHKHRTDPENADSDGDGIPDGDWRERREFAYTVRSVVQVMRPVTPEYLTDDHQDARVLDETDLYVELEVVHYPLCTIAEAPADAVAPEDLARWLEPGPTSNASPELGAAIREAMRDDGIELGDATSRKGVVAAARWLLNRAEYHKGFTSFVTGFDDEGRPFVPRELRDGAEANARSAGHSLEEQWRYEVFAADMFANRKRGSCTSSAIYMTGCLRALGVPTRTVLCIPIIDASDRDEWRLLGVGIEHKGVKQIIRGALDGGRRAWTSHTFNEVYVEGRWRRLNYTTLDQGILDETYLGLMTHIATFHDWADARFWETVGRRQKTDSGPDVFGFRNPYSTISLRDEIGEHCDVLKLDLPPITVHDTTLEIVAMHWSDDRSILPRTIYEWSVKREAFGLVAEIPVDSMQAFQEFARASDTTLSLKSGSRTTGRYLNPGTCWFIEDRVFVYVPISGQGREWVEDGTSWRVSARNESDEARWVVDLEVSRR